MTRTLMLAALLFGCPKDPARTAPDFAETPRLPPPSSTKYAVFDAESTDRPLASVVAGRTLTGPLSSTASGLALDLTTGKIPSIRAWSVRDAAWRAGWAYPVDDARGWAGPLDGPPPQAYLEWLSKVGPDERIGTVRARDNESDLWVVVKSTPRVDLGEVPRQFPLGGTLILPAVGGGRYVIADARGNLTRGSLDDGHTESMTNAGEWLIQIHDDAGLVALFPVYVGMAPPLVPLTSFHAEPARSADEALGLADDILAEIRDVYGTGPLVQDRLLDAAARSVVRGDAQATERMATTLGVESLAHVDCTASTVQTCMETLLWDPRQRRELLARDAVYGLATDLVPGGIRVVVLIAPQPAL